MIQSRWHGRARHKPGVMNKSEQAYANYLEGLKVLGTIESWQFEALKFKLADKTFYTPDFLVVYPDGLMELVEVKGHWEDDARVKIKCAAEKFSMFRFVAAKPLAKKRGGGWEREEF